MGNWEKAKTIVFVISSIAVAIAAWMIPFKRVRKKGYRDFEQELKYVGASNHINAILRAEK